MYKKLLNIQMDSKIIIAEVFFVNIAKYMVIPFFSIYLVKYMNFSMTDAGIIIAIRSLGQRGFVLLSGWLVDYYGPKLIAIIGLILMALSYIAIAYFDKLSYMVISTLIMGFGGSLFNPAVKTVLVDVKAYSDKVFVLSLRSTAINAGSAIGPLLGIIIFSLTPKLTFIITGLSLMFLALIFSFLKLNVKENISTEKVNFLDILVLMKNRKVIKLMFYSIVFFIFLIQIETTYPLFAAHTFNNSVSGILFVINASIVILFQMPLTGWIERASLNKAFIYGMCALGLGLIITGLSSSLELIFLLSFAIFSFGEIILLPKLDSDITSFVPRNAIGTAFGMLGMASAVGALIGGVVSSHLYNFFMAHANIDNYWIILGSIAFFSALLPLYGLRKVSF